MKKLIWDESYSVHVAELDQQHQKLFNLINRLYEMWESNKSGVTHLSAMDEMSVQCDVIDELEEYAVYHFTAEEEYLLKHQCPKIEQHKKSHILFIYELQSMKKGIRFGEDITMADMIRFLIEWLRGHVLGTDKLYDPTAQT